LAEPSGYLLGNGCFPSKETRFADYVKPERFAHPSYNLFKGLLKGLVFGLIFGLVSGLVFGQLSGLDGWLVFGLYVGLVFGLYGGLGGGLRGGLGGWLGSGRDVFIVSEIRTHSFPNEGIIRSVRNALLSGLYSGLYGGLSIGLFVLLVSPFIELGGGLLR
jgi:hypothetical protein